VTIFAFVTNPLRDKNLKGVVGYRLSVVALLALACGGKKANQTPVPEPTQPLPLTALASVKVPVLPLTLIGADETLAWPQFANQKAVLASADSVIGALLPPRAPEVTWVLPEELRRQARRSPTFAANPDQMGTAILRNARIGDFVPDPFRAELRALVAIADARFAMAPAQLVFKRSITPGAPAGTGTAELTVVLVDARLGRVSWRTVARGDGLDPWTALTRAVKALTPGLP
jgi:hypothetical protein